MDNPFASILEKLESLEHKLNNIQNSFSDPAEIENKPLTASEASSFLQLKMNTIYYMTSRELIPYYKRGGHLYFFKEDLLKWLKSSRNREVPVLDIPTGAERHRKRRAFRIA